MKTKKLNKKLRLRKETIAQLVNEEQNKVRGGIPISWTTRCEDCDSKCVYATCYPC